MNEAFLSDDQVCRVILETVASLVVVMDPDRRVLLFNRACEELTGVSTAEARGRPISDFLVPDEVGPVEAACAVVAGEGEAVVHDHHLRCPGGTRLIAWSTNRVSNADGSVRFLVCSGTDVTEERAREAELRAAHARLAEIADHHESLFRAIFDHSHLLIAYLDQDLRFVRVNRRYAAVEDEDPEWFVGKKHFDLYPHEENEAIFRRVLETGVLHVAHAKPFEYAHEPRRGTTHWDWVLVPLPRAAGAGRGLVLTLLDVSERVNAISSLERTLEEKNALLREVHHRVRNNLHVVSSLLSLQSANARHEGTEAALAKSQRRVHAMATIHENLLDGEAFADVRFSDYVRDLVERLREAHDWAPDDLTLDVDERLRLSIDAAIPCGLVLHELVSNAMTHAYPHDDPGRPVRIRCHRDAERWLWVAVEDWGVGLGDASADSLGLLLVRRLTDQLDGELVVNPADPTRVAVSFRA